MFVPGTEDVWKNFIDCLYDYSYSGVNGKDSSDEKQAGIFIETDQSKPVSHTVADQSKLIIYTDRSSEAVSGSGNFDEPIDLTIN